MRRAVAVHTRGSAVRASPSPSSRGHSSLQPLASSLNGATHRTYNTAARSNIPDIEKVVVKRPSLDRIDASIFNAPTVDDFINEVAAAIPEAALMDGPAEGTAENAAATNEANRSPSRRLYGTFRSEADRAFGSAVCLYLAYRGGDKDYTEYTALQPKEQRLGRAHFADQHALVRRLLPDAEAVRAAMWGAVCNDLGKLHSVIQLYEQVVSPTAVDHDRRLGALLQKASGFFPAFSQLSTEAQQDLATGFLSGSDIAQFQQLELPARGLAGLTTLKPRALDTYVLHSIMDVGGALWHVFPRGSAVMTDGTWRGFDAAAQSLSLFKSGATVAGVYADYAARRAAMAGISSATDQHALQCLAAMSRSANPRQGEVLMAAWRTLPEEVRATLKSELLRFYIPDQPDQIFVGYAPAFFANVLASPAASSKPAVGYGLAMQHIARIFRYARNLIDTGIKDRLPNGIFLAEPREIAFEARKDPTGALARPLQHELPGFGARLRFAA